MPFYSSVCARKPLDTCEVSVRLVYIPDDDEEEGDKKASKTPQPLSSSALIKLAEGEEDVIEDLELSDDD